MKGDAFYVSHMLDCIHRIERYSTSGEREFLSDDLQQDAVLRNLQILAESSQRLSTELKSRFPSVDWKGLSGLRNVLVHDYLGVSLERIWQIVSRDLPPLKQALLACLPD